MSYPTINNPFDRDAIRRMLLRIPVDEVMRHPERVADESTRFLEIIQAQYGDEGVLRFMALVREVGYEMARENAVRNVVAQSQLPAPRKSGAGAFAVLMVIFVVGLLLGVVLRR